MKQNIEALQDDIEAGVAELVAGEWWATLARPAARFPRYRFRNQRYAVGQIAVRRVAPDLVTRVLYTKCVSRKATGVIH